MDDETYYRLRRAIKAADEGHTKNLGDFAQYAEEPPWRAELLEALERAVEHWYHSTDEDLLDVLQPHIKAAEQRGRREALAEAAAKLRKGWSELRGTTSASRVMAFAADLIDPDASESP